MGEGGSNRPRRGANVSLQVQRNVGTGAVIFDEVAMCSLEHFGAIKHSADKHLRPPAHLSPTDPIVQILAGRPAAGVGDPCQQPQPGGHPAYHFAAQLERNPAFVPSIRNAAAAQQEDPGSDSAEEDNVPGHAQPQQAPTPQQHDRLHDGFRLYRALATDVFLLTKQHRQDTSAAGIFLTEAATMFAGGPVSETRIAELVDALNTRAITDLADLAHLNPRVVLQRNEPRHALNVRLQMLQAQRLGKRLITWNADHVPHQPQKLHNAGPPQSLTRLEQAVAMRVKNARFQHTTADTWYYEGARYVLLDNTCAEAGAFHNNEVEACSLLTDEREHPDDGSGPYWRLQYLPAALLVRPLRGHNPTSILQGVSDFASHGAAFPLCPRPNLEPATILMPAPGVGTEPKAIRRINIPVGDWHAYTDYGVQGRTFGEETWVIDLTLPPHGIKRATLYVLLTRFKSLDHIRLLRPLYTTPAARKKVIAAFLKATHLEPDLAAELRLLSAAAAATRNRYPAEFRLAEELDAQRQTAGAAS
ncbi:hypothetical protein PLESTM_001770500 [Pleodorina starrii]|nr:hypothetical protein PLESTM_001770500 [Pleodorina starrii]